MARSVLLSYIRPAHVSASPRSPIHGPNRPVGRLYGDIVPIYAVAMDPPMRIMCEECYGSLQYWFTETPDVEGLVASESRRASQNVEAVLYDLIKGFPLEITRLIVLYLYATVAHPVVIP